MTRDGTHWAMRATFTTTGPRSGTTSNAHYFRWTAAGTPSTADLSSLAGDVATFWNGASGGSSTIGYYLGSQILRGTGAFAIDAYSLDLADPRHYFGSPVQTYLKNLGTPANLFPIPNECAVVLSYRAAYGSDPEHDGVTRPRASDRGRMYFGPLNTSSMLNASAPNGTIVVNVAPAVLTNIQNAATALKPAVATHNFEWSVWSRKEQLFKPVADIALDNSFDTQRRREVEPSPLLTWVGI